MGRIHVPSKPRSGIQYPEAPDHPSFEYGRRVQAMRLARGLKQIDIAGRMKCSLRSVKYWENGRVPDHHQHELLMVVLQPNLPEAIAINRLWQGYKLRTDIFNE